MAPELLSNDICGKEADIWAFGCILYEVIFKKSPFFDTSEGMVWKKILND
jgi:3-phosphoinositide dependent protein kinase-1